MRSHKGPRQHQRLLDVLEEVPLNDFESSTWDTLSRQAQRSFRLVCKQSRTLGEQLITSTHHDLHPTPQWPPGLSSQTAQEDEALWHQAATGHAAFLSRLPRLASLTLSQWPTKSGLASELQLCGTATQGRVTALALHGRQLSHASLRAVRLAFPQLRELSMEGAGPSGVEDADTHLDLQGPLFLPLHGMPWLTKLSVTTTMDTLTEALRSLADLATLKHLDLALLSPGQDARDLLLLTGLCGLEHCSILLLHSESALPPFAALLATTRLTHLKLHGISDSRNRPPPRTNHPPAAHAAALALLGDLSRLQSLHLWDTFVVDSAALAALRRLTQLTELGVGRVAPLTPGARPAHLPLLQQLQIGWRHHRLPPNLLRQLLPLLPLPSLVGLNGGALLVDVGDAHSDDEGEVGPAAWAGTLDAALQGLAASPLLGHTDGVTFTCGAQNTRTRPFAQVAAHLRGTAPELLACVCLAYLELEGCPWGVLHACWPGLRRLRLRRCDLSSGTLAALVEGLPALQRLDLEGCWWPGKEARVGWVVVAAHRSQPLQVKVGPVGVPAEVRLRCGAVQQVLFGLQTIQWLD